MRYGYFFRDKDPFEFAQPKVSEIAVGPNTVDLAKSSRQSTLVDPGNAAHISHMHEISHICARDPLKMIDNLVIAFCSLFWGRSRLDRSVGCHRGNYLETSYVGH